MAGVDHRTVDLDPNHSIKRNNYSAAGTLRVGAHVTLNAAGQLVEVGAGAVPTKMIAAEAAYVGKGIFSTGTTVNTYLAGENVNAIVPQNGGGALVLLADGQNVTMGDALEPAPNGEWRAVTTGTVGFFAGETLNNTSGAAVFIKGTAA